MNKVILFDFNRTLYDSDAGKLFPEVLELLAVLRQREYRLHLVCMIGEGRDTLITDLILDKYFDTIHMVKEKTLKLFKQLLIGDINIVIGDRIRKEIALGVASGAKTIWFKNGKFAGELPQTDAEQPMHTIFSLSELYELLS